MAPRRVELRDLAAHPDRLLDLGYTRREEGAPDPVRGVLYEKAISSDESQLKLLVQIHFELAISDDAGHEYSELCSHSFNGVKLQVLDRQMESADNLSFAEETEKPISVGVLKLELDSLGEVERLVSLLTPGACQR